MKKSYTTPDVTELVLRAEERVASNGCTPDPLLGSSSPNWVYVDGPDTTYLSVLCPTNPEPGTRGIDFDPCIYRPLETQLS